MDQPNIGQKSIDRHRGLQLPIDEVLRVVTKTRYIMQPSLKLFRGTLADLFLAGRADGPNNLLNIKLKASPAYMKLLTIPTTISISYSRSTSFESDQTTVMVDLNEEIHCGMVILQTYMRNGKIVPFNTPGAVWTTVNEHGTVPLDGMCAYMFTPSEVGEYRFRARYDADEPDCPFDSIHWMEGEPLMVDDQWWFF